MALAFISTKLPLNLNKIFNPNNTNTFFILIEQPSRPSLRPYTPQKHIFRINNLLNGSGPLIETIVGQSGWMDAFNLYPGRRRSQFCSFDECGPSEGPSRVSLKNLHLTSAGKIRVVLECWGVLWGFGFRVWSLVLNGRAGFTCELGRLKSRAFLRLNPALWVGFWIGLDGGRVLMCRVGFGVVSGFCCWAEFYC